MKSILIVYPKMIVGGSTTSLLSLLSEIDYSKYRVDLCLFFRGGVLEKDIPSQVNVLPYGYLIQNRLALKLYKLFNLKYLWNRIYSRHVAKKYNNPVAAQQYVSSCDCEPCRTIKEKYDIAIGFLEGYCNKYVAKRVKADKKFLWIHVNYEECRFVPDFDIESFTKVNNVIAVSEECKKALQRKFPSLSEKIICVENILSDKRLKMLAMQPIDIEVDETNINFVSSCRIDFGSKGLDRALNQIKLLKDNKVNNFNRLNWYIIGDGIDYSKLYQMVDEYNLNECVHLLGNKLNPYSYIAKMSILFQPSIHEGKPMAVTEGQILGLPAMVTNYSSAREQVRSDYDGLVVENSEDGIYNGLVYLLNHPEKIKEWTQNVKSRSYSNIEEIDKINDLLQ